MKKFNDLEGKAKKMGPDRMKFVDGLNTFRIVSGIIPGYKYWMKTKDGMSVPMDCLSFDRELEQFTNKTKDWVKHYEPEKRCSWAYASFVIDRTDNKLKLLDHKKKLFGQILDAAKKLGDPTDPVKGWDIICTRVKTGPQPFNVEYKLEHFDLSNSPLSTEDLELIEEMPDIEEVLKLPTPEQQKSFLEEYILADVEDTDADNSDTDDLTS